VFKAIVQLLEKTLTHAIEVAAEMIGYIVAFVGMTFLTLDFGIQNIMFADLKSKIANPDSDISNTINSYINELDYQMNDISITINNLNDKENDYMNQKIIFNSKLNELANQNQFFKEFDTMNTQTFTETKFFTTNQIEN